jgi:FlaG/FlaF family flagellin (archaellin)
MKRSNGYKSSHTDSHIRASPVLGVLVMVALTVLFVAVLGTFAFGMSFGSITTPQATMSTELSVPNDQIQITHIGGDTLSSDTTQIVIANESDGQRMVFGPAPDAESFEVGQSVEISTTSGSIEGWNLGHGNRTFELRQGMTYTISIMDTNSESVIYRTSLTSA